MDLTIYDVPLEWHSVYIMSLTRVVRATQVLQASVPPRAQPLQGAYVDTLPDTPHECLESVVLATVGARYQSLHQLLGESGASDGTVVVVSERVALRILQGVVTAYNDLLVGVKSGADSAGKHGSLSLDSVQLDDGAATLLSNMIRVPTRVAGIVSLEPRAAADAQRVSDGVRLSDFGHSRVVAAAAAVAEARACARVADEAHATRTLALTAAACCATDYTSPERLVIMLGCGVAWLAAHPPDVLREYDAAAVREATEAALEDTWEHADRRGGLRSAETDLLRNAAEPGSATAADDVFAMGVILAHLLFGQRVASDLVRAAWRGELGADRVHAAYDAAGVTRGRDPVVGLLVGMLQPHTDSLQNLRVSYLSDTHIPRASRRVDRPPLCAGGTYMWATWVNAYADTPRVSMGALPGHIIAAMQ